ncbi:MAG: hypothetical protein K940chlam8_01226, partial [Chlamydiae bacterium]|nr:hypothetical protein [Chlamydiota bacterium]
FQFKNTLITKGFFDIDGIYQKGFFHIGLKCSDVFIEKDGFSLKIPFIRGAHFLYDTKTSQLIGSIRLKEAVFYPRYLSPIPFGSCKVHIFNQSVILPQVYLKGFLGNMLAKVHLNFDTQKHIFAHVLSSDLEIIMNRDFTIQAKGQFTKKINGSILSKKNAIEFDLNLYDTPLTGVLKRQSPSISKLKINNFSAPIYIKNAQIDEKGLVAFDILTKIITTSGVVPKLSTLHMHVQNNNQAWKLDGNVSNMGSFTGFLDFNEFNCVIKNFLFHYSHISRIPKRPSRNTFFVDVIKFENGVFTIPFSKVKNETKDIAILYDISLKSFSVKDLTAKGTLLEKQMHFELFGKKTPLIRPKKTSVFYSFYDQKLHPLTLSN